MIGVFFNQDGRVYKIHYRPSQLSEDLLRDAILVENIPTEPEPKFGKTAVLYVIDVQEKKLEWVYEDRELTEQEKIELLENDNAELMFKSALTEIELETIKDENAELMLRVAMLEMGGDI